MSIYLDVKETAELLRTTPARIYTSIHEREFPESIFLRFKRKILFKKQELINWLEKGVA